MDNRLQEIDPYAATVAVLARLRLAVNVHRNRLVKTLAPTDTATVAAGARVPAVAPSTASPPTRDELDELCVYFGVAIDAETAGGHAVLREARRVLEQVSSAPLAAGVSAAPSAGVAAAMEAVSHHGSLSGCQLRRWQWLSAVSLVPSVPTWQTSQQAVLAKAELNSAPMAAAMLVAANVGHAVREAGVVAAAAADADDGASSAAPLSEAALAACHLLRASLAFEQRCQLFQSLNVMRSMQRTLALRSGGQLARPLRARGPPCGDAPAGRPTAGRGTARGGVGGGTVVPPSARSDVDCANCAPSTAAVSSAALDTADSTVAMLLDATTGDDAIDGLAVGLSVATCPVLPPVRLLTARPPPPSARHISDGGNEWFSTGSDTPVESAAAPAPASDDPTCSIFVRDSSGRRIVHQAALADLAALTAEVGRIVAHYSNDSAVAAVYGTGRYDNALLVNDKTQGAEDAEVGKRLAVASALPAALRVVSRCIACEAAYQRAKVMLLLNLLQAFEACDDARVATDLAQQMTDIMAARPRLDLSASDFEESYRASTLALRLHSVLLERLLAAHVGAGISTLAAAAAVGHGAGTLAALEAGERARRRREARRGIATSCATVALALSRELAGMEARTLAAAQRVYQNIGATGFSPVAISRLRCLLLSRGLTLSESSFALPPVDGAGHESAERVQQGRHEDDSEAAPWVQSCAVAAAAEARAFSGGAVAASVPPLRSEELRARPGLLPTLGVWASVQRVSHELIELREALRRARPRMVWVPWTTLLPRLMTSSASLDQAPAQQQRSLVPGAARMQRAEATLATAKRFLAVVARDGAAAAIALNSDGAAQSVLQLLEAEKHALILILTRQRPQALAPVLPSPLVGGSADDLVVADAARAASATLNAEAEEACRKLEGLLAVTPPPFLALAPRDDAECSSHEVLLRCAERDLSAALAEASKHREQLETQASILAITQGGAVREMETAALRNAVSTARTSLNAAELIAREAHERDVRMLCSDLEAEIAGLQAKLAEVRGVDMSEAKKQALRQAPNAVASWDSPERAPTVCEESVTADNGQLGERAAARRAEAEQHREGLLGQLRALIALRKLKEAASESVHRRRIDDLRNGAINAISDAVDGGALSEHQRNPDRQVGRAQVSWQLRSVAEVQEAEQELRDELRETQARNSAVLDRLSALKAAVAGSEVQHNSELVGKVRQLVRRSVKM